jgi:hypothetical protein
VVLTLFQVRAELVPVDAELAGDRIDHLQVGFPSHNALT